MEGIEHLNSLEKELQVVSRLIFNKYRLPWWPPECPICHEMLSQKLGSDRLVCLACGLEYRLTLYVTERLKRALQDDGEANF